MKLRLIGQNNKINLEVFRAEDRRTGEAVAAKLLHADQSRDRDLLRRFLQESQVLTDLRHPSLVAVRDMVAEGGRLAIVMDLVNGVSLGEVLHERGTLPPAMAVQVAAAALDALAVAHDKRVVHRDVKPDNVLLEDGWEDFHPGGVRLADFGVARILEEGRSKSTGLLGTPAYMSPELLSASTAETPSDVYGVGVMLYELLAGRTPFAGAANAYAVAKRHVEDEPPPIPVPEERWAEVSSLLAKDPRRRPDARVAASRLRALLPGLAGVPALEPQADPTEYTSSRGPGTLVRGWEPEPEPEEEVDPEQRLSLSDLDLGAPGSETLLRPLERSTGEAPVRTRRVAEEAPPVAWYRNRKVLGAVAATVVLVVVVLFVALRPGAEPGPDPGPKGPDTLEGTLQASVAGTSLPTGLTVSRSATYDASTATVTVTITYAAQNAPLAGPYLEVFPSDDPSVCPDVTWTDGDQQRNLPTVTGIDAPCAWSVDPGPVDRQGTASVSAEVSMELSGDDAQTTLQEWLQQETDATDAAVTDDQVTSTAYPVQRLQDISVVAPDSTVTGKTLTLRLLPVWPNGPDELHPLYKSPAVGPASSTLGAMAGGESGVRFSDACSGGLAVSSDGLVVTTLTVSSDCAVAAQVGNFTNLTSNTFTIASRGG